MVLDHIILLPSDVLEALRGLDYIEEDSHECVQVGIDRKIHVTVKTEQLAEELVNLDTIGVIGIPVVITMTGVQKSLVKVNYLPHEVPNDELRRVLSEFGKVHIIKNDLIVGTTICNGIRTVRMTIRLGIPS